MSKRKAKETRSYTSQLDQLFIELKVMDEMVPLQQLITSQAMKSVPILMHYLPDCLTLYCNNNNRSRRENMGAFFNHAAELCSKDANAYAKCLGVLYPLVQQELSDPELLMFMNKTLGVINLCKLSNQGWEDIINGVLIARCSVQNKILLSQLLVTCLDESTKYGYNNLLVNLTITIENPSYNVIRAMGMVSEELRLCKTYVTLEKERLQQVFQSINDRCLELNRILCTEIAVKEYFASQVRYYADKRYAEPLFELVQRLLASTHSYHFRLVELVLELCAEERMIGFFDQVSLGPNIIDFYTDVWSDQPKKMLPFITETSSVGFLIRTIINMSGMLNANFETILIFLKRADFRNTINKCRGLFNDHQIDQCEQLLSLVQRE